VAGGIAPLVAVYLYTTFGSGYAVAIYVALCSVVTVIAVATYGETRSRDLSADDAMLDGTPRAAKR
jgi:uncharacterized membrane protein